MEESGDRHFITIGSIDRFVVDYPDCDRCADLTGLPRELARFQARSAFTGVGFTTSETEKVVNHPVRRRILMMLMLMGNAGIVTAMASMILAFVNATGPSTSFLRFFWLVMALLLFWFVATSQWIDRRLTPIISWGLKRWTGLHARDYAAVMHLHGDYGVMELQVQAQDWLSNKTLAELDLPREGVLVLGVQRADGSYEGAPKGPTRINPDDTLIMYGRSPILADLDCRGKGSAGEQAHLQAVAQQQRLLAEQQRRLAEEQQQHAETRARRDSEM